MAIDNLNYYSSWLPAWQQTDRYSSQPWCLKSKNLDIFSSSKSVKATAWDQPVNTDESWVVLVDQTWNLIYKSNGSVYDRSSGTEVLVKSGIPTNFPTWDVSYDWRVGTYSAAQWGTVKQLISKYENWTLKYFTIFTDRSRYFYSSEEYNIPAEDEIYTASWWTKSSSVWKKSDTSATSSIKLKINNLRGMSKARLMISADNTGYAAAEWHITINSIYIDKPKYWYNAETEQMEYRYWSATQYITWWEQLDDSTGKTVYVDIPLFSISDDYSYYLTISLKHTYGTDNTHTWTHGELMTNVYWYNDGYNYLSIRDDRYLEDIWEYYWEKWDSFQTLYAWEWEWVDNDNYERVVRYDLVKYMWWSNDVSMDIVWMVAWNEQIYMIGNMNWNWYIFPCDLSWGRWTPFIAYWCAFKGVTNIDYLLYLVWEDRWISTLWVFNQQELVPLVWGNLESWVEDYIDSDEQYNFDWKIVNYRKNLIMATSDWRIFRYGQTYWGKWGTFIHDLKPSEHDSLTINTLQAKDNNLTIYYTVVDTIEWTPTTTHWAITYNDDTTPKNYNTEWEAVYPVVLWNHLLEKEESDLYASYILPDWDTHLEFWGCANHYHFWTFKTSQYLLVEDPAWTHKFWIKGANWNYYLEFVERVESPDWLDWYTFRLVWSLPLMAAGATNTVVYLDDDWETLVDFIKFSEVNHFRKIWDVYPDTFTFEDEEYWKYTEWEFRFHNLNNKLELPKSHSLQVKVIGYWTANHTPELFALDLVANQRDRW